MLVLLVVALGFSASSDGSSVLYADDLRSQAVTMAGRGGTFQALLPRMSSVERTELVSVVEEVQTSADEVLEFLGTSEPPPELVGPASVLSVATVTWADGTLAFQQAMLDAADGTGGGAEERVLDALVQLRTGDLTYLEFVRAMEAEGVPQPVSPLPDARFLPESYPLIAAAESLANLAVSDTSLLELRASVANQQIATDPEWVVDTEGAIVVPETTTLAVQALLANQGNARSEASTLVIQMEGSDGTSEELTRPVPPLEAGEETTVVAEGLEVTPGATYRIQVQLPLVEGEEETDDNTRTVQLRINPETPDTTTTTTETTTTTGGG